MAHTPPRATWQKKLKWIDRLELKTHKQQAKQQAKQKKQAITMASPINNVLSHNVSAMSLGEILSSIDLDSYEQATTTYRKPSYQRGLKKPEKWGKKLVESIIEGMSIGSLHLSSWSKIIIQDGEVPRVDTFYNIEDGQTRLNSCIEFIKGVFDCEYGSYNDVESTFNAYQVSVIILSKANPQISDEIYFGELNRGFSLLQDGTPLTASDRFASMYKSEGYAGSPLVNFTVKLVKHESFSKLFKEFMKVKLDSRGKGKDLANMIGLVSGIWMGSEFLNSKYFTHVKILESAITDEEKSDIIEVLAVIQNIITSALEKKPKYKSEQLASMFKTTQKFTGSMILDIKRCNTHDEKVDVSNCWITFINEYRERKKNDKNNSWLDDDVYKSLAVGHRRNCEKDDFPARLGAVQEWWSNRSGAAADMGASDDATAYEDTVSELSDASSDDES